MWEPRRLTTLWISTACYSDNFTYISLCILFAHDKKLFVVHPKYTVCCGRPIRSRSSVVFLSPTPSLVNVSRFHVTLNASHAALPMATSKFSPYVHSFIHSSMLLQHFVRPWPLLQFHNPFYKDGRTPWTGDQPVTKPLPTHRTTQTYNKRTQTYMPQVVFEPTIPASDQAKTVHASDRAVAVTAFLYTCT
jgi:hypothetical protein